MIYIDFLDTETGKQVFEEGKIIEAQNSIVDILKIRFATIAESIITTIKSIGSLHALDKLRAYAVTCESVDMFMSQLLKQAQGKAWKKKHRSVSRGTDEAFVGLMKIGGPAVLKLSGVDPSEAAHYSFKSVVLKEKRLEPDIVGFPVLERNKKKIFLEFQSYVYPFIKYNLVAKALMACAHNNDKGNVKVVIIYTEQKFKDAALSINAFNKPVDEIFDDQIKEIVLENYSLEELLAIDPKLIVLAPFTVPKDISSSHLSAYGRQWKKTIHTVYDKTECNDAINVMSLIFLSRFRDITREGIKAMLDFDILDTVAGKQVYDEGRDKGRKEGREEGLDVGRKEGLEEGLNNMRKLLVMNLVNQFGNLTSDILEAVNAIKDFDYIQALFAKSFTYDNVESFKQCLVPVKAG